MDEAARQLVRQRAKDRCEYCRIPQDALPWARFQIEHIRARQHGGSDDLKNLALACRRCNAYKGPNLSSVDPETGGVIPLFNPRLDTWSEHFLVLEHRIVGLTAVGRASATLLNMNDPDRVQLRGEFAALGRDMIQRALFDHNDLDCTSQFLLHGVRSSCGSGDPVEFLLSDTHGIA